ncbi:MAG TPA: hypothetical protein VHD62_01480 [Opitutaceae bacterium]|nr:hypothetical protein [Opitutaceae bacterium]
MHLISRLALPVLHRRLVRSAAVFFAACTLSAAVFAQADQNANSGQAGDNANGNGGGRGRRGQNGNGGGRGNFDPAQMQQQMIDRIREQLGVTDDAEWAVISERLNKVMELRRTASPMGGFNFRGFGGPGGNGGGRRGGNGAAANPEQEALTQAITDKLPDAEIKSRLERLREVRKKNEEALTKAQEDLRAVLSVRQEAAAVVAGLLP